MGLIVVAFVAGLIAGISPCVLPVLPAIFVGWAVPRDEDAPALSARRRSLAIIAGLVLSFSLLTALGAEVVSALGLPETFLHNLGIATIALIGLSLLVPNLEALLERPFTRFTRGTQSRTRSGFVLGLGLGLVFVPCAGPILATVAILGARHRASFESVALSLAFGLGVAVPLLSVALAGERVITRSRWLSARSRMLRPMAGVILILVAVAAATNITASLQRDIPSYTQHLQQLVEGNAATTRQLRSLEGATSRGNLAECENAAASGETPTLGDCGIAPNFSDITAWRNTPGSRPLNLRGLRGHVVLVDFWTYTCINCQRTVPHVEAWYQRYRRDGLVVIGVEAPEFTFEHVVSNVVAGARSLGITYPIAIDDQLATWNAYSNEYWPAEYLIDANGVIRHVSYGEGAYVEQEHFIRTLLSEANPNVHLPPPSNLPDLTPTSTISPETYLGANRSAYLANGSPAHGTVSYTMPSALRQYFYALGGTWTTSEECLTAGAGATLALNVQAKAIYLVLAGTGRVTISFPGTATTVQNVHGFPTLYRLENFSNVRSGVLHLALTPGVSAYDFTFG